MRHICILSLGFHWKKCIFFWSLISSCRHLRLDAFRYIQQWKSLIRKVFEEGC